MRNKVSVIIPVYNAERYIERCARSLFNQAFSDIEYIFVDDCTQDASIDRLKETIKEYPNRAMNIKICAHEVNRGVSAARNTGLSAATGEYVIHCDSDDWMDITMISTMYSRMLAMEADIVWCDYNMSFADHDELVVQSFEETPLSCMKALLTERMHGSLCNKLVRRSLYIDNGLFFRDGLNMWEDVRMVFQLFTFAKKVSYCSGGFYYYMQNNEASVCGSRGMDKIDNMLANGNDVLAFIRERNLDRALAPEIQIFKLASKQILLLTLQKENFKRWKYIYPESNKHIWKHTTFSLRMRTIAWCASMGWWAIIDAWILLRKMRRRN